MTACVRFIVFHLNHIVKHWHHVLHDTLHDTPTARKGTESMFSLPPLPPFPSAWHPLAPFTRYTDEEIPPLPHITSQISHPSEVHCSLECLDNFSDMSETDRLDLPIFRTWYPQNKIPQHSVINQMKKSNSAHIFNIVSTNLSASKRITAGVKADTICPMFFGQSREWRFPLNKSLLENY